MEQWLEGDVIGDRYQIVKIIGRGGSSCVYQVKDMHLDRIWAMKIVKQVDCANYLLHDSRLWECNVFPLVIDCFEIDTYVFWIMELIEGITLSQYCKKGLLEEKKIILFALQICDLLWRLHRMDGGYLYLDLKSENIVVKDDDTLVLIDFGALYKKGSNENCAIYATPGYASPEQLDKNQFATLDERSDIYSFGVLLKHLMVEIDPIHPAFTTLDIGNQNVMISQEMIAIVNKMMSFHKEDRYDSIDCVKHEMEKLKKIPFQTGKKLLVKIGYYGLIGISAIILGIGLEGFTFENWAAYQSVIVLGVVFLLISYAYRRIVIERAIKQRKSWKILYSVTLYEKHVLSIWMLLVMISALMNLSWIVEQGESKSDYLYIEMLTEDKRNLLIQDEGIYYTKEPIYFKWEHNTDGYQVSINEQRFQNIVEGTYALNMGKIKTDKCVKIQFRCFLEGGIRKKTIQLAYG